MAGFITLAQAIMGATGGVPVQPAGANTVIEKLRAAKSMIPGDIGGVLGKVLSGGPASILQNPVGALTGSIQGQLGGIMGQITKLTGLANGANPLQGITQAITGGGLVGVGGLQSVMSQFMGHSNALSGLGGTTAGGFSLIDAIGHANISTVLGPAMASTVGINTAMNPIMMAPNLTAMVSQVSSIASGVTNGTISDAAAAATLTGIGNTLKNSMAVSDNAFATVQAAIVPIAQTTGIISMIASGPPEMAVIANMLIQEAHKAEIQGHLDEQIRA